MVNGGDQPITTGPIGSYTVLYIGPGPSHIGPPTEVHFSSKAEIFIRRGSLGITIPNRYKTPGSPFQGKIPGFQVKYRYFSRTKLWNEDPDQNFKRTFLWQPKCEDSFARTN